ncbi:hypothetical protein OIY81_157 [Cryptosporidium canis]|uniref:Uncharacterized protein n=1 Tax=Cryptosporidium canis TaxID=195482 RepID=A0ABQ8P645_9CRYT|nr:hypothetical protein OJ252_2943 [Cryptosporidium canis]KAJ1615213.1 hypothetical protein OIY81_157 [Cryptosporidium canis]
MKDVSAISELMGSYLLKGWIMLGDACPSCEEVPLLEDPSNGLKYCMKCSPPIKFGRNSDKSDRALESTNNEGKCLSLTKSQPVNNLKENDKAFKEALEENVNYMILETSKIGAHALNSTDVPLEKR